MTNIELHCEPISITSFCNSGSAHRWILIIIPKVTLLVFRVRCEILNRSSNQSKECECIMEFPVNHFNVLIKVRSGYVP